MIERSSALSSVTRGVDRSYKSKRGGLALSEERHPSSGERADGKVGERRSVGARSPLRVLPDPDSPQGRAEALAGAWAQAEQPGWCVDAEAAIGAGCSTTDMGAAAMPASERRAVHLRRQRIRAQAILAAEPPTSASRERARHFAIALGSAAVHLIGFAVLAYAVADLQPKPPPDAHEHLFEARAVVPIDPTPALPTPSEPALAEDQPAPESPPTPASPSPKPKPKPNERRKPAEPAAAKSSSEPAPYELRGFEFSSEGELAAGEPGGESWGHPGGQGSGKGSGSGEHEDAPAKAKSSKPDAPASPRGGLLEPEYPAALERRGVEGSVLVKVWIDEHGHVIKAEVVESSGEEAFDHNALMTAQRQEWTAATLDGDSVASTRRYRVHFRLR